MKQTNQIVKLNQSTRRVANTHMRQLGHVLKSGRNNWWPVMRYKQTRNGYFTISEQVVYGLVKKLSEQN